MPLFSHVELPDVAPSFAATLGQEASTSETFQVALLGLFILFLAAKVGEELFRRLGQPGVIGELVGGFVVGPFALGLVEIGTTATVFAELGVVILLFVVGLEVRIDDLFAVGPMALAVGVIGFILPIVAGASVGILAGSDALSAVLRGPRAGGHQHRHHQPGPRGAGRARSRLRTSHPRRRHRG